jgi:hypothetical protein
MSFSRLYLWRVGYLWKRQGGRRGVSEGSRSAARMSHLPTRLLGYRRERVALQHCPLCSPQQVQLRRGGMRSCLTDKRTTSFNHKLSKIIYQKKE